MSRVRVMGLSAALVTAVIAGGAFLDAVVSAAAPSVGSPAPTAATNPSSSATAGGAVGRQPSEYCLAFRAALAANLGVTQDQLVAAARKAAGTALDQAVADGKIREAAANRIKARIDAAPATSCRILAGWRASLQRRLAGRGPNAGSAPVQSPSARP